MSNLDQEYQYYKSNQKEFLGKYTNKILVIKNQEIVGVYDTEAEAYSEAINKYELGTFLIQKCVPDKENTQTFHSRVNFSH